MKLDIIIALIALVNTIGFYTGNLDWLLIYYGCAPAEVKDRADRDKILGAASIASALVFVIAATDLFIRNLGFNRLIGNKLLWLCGIITVIMVIYTYIQTRSSLLYFFKRLANKTKSPENIKKDIENKKAHDELVANRAKKKKIKEQKREEFLKRERIRSKSRN